MKRFLSILLILLFPFLLNAQDAEPGNFYFSTIEDQVRELNKKAKSLGSDKAAEILNLAGRAYNLAEAEDLNELGAESQALMGLAYFYLLEIDKSLELLNNSYRTAVSYQFDTLRVFTVYQMGLVYLFLNDSERALDLFKEGLSFSGNEGSEDKVLILKEISRIYISSDDYDQAQYYIEDALNITENLNLLQLELDLQLLSGEIAQKDGRVRDAVRILLALLKATEGDDKNVTVRSAAMALIGRCYAILKDYSRALSYGQDALLLAVSTGLESERLNAYDSLSAIYRYKGNYEEAYNYQTLYYTQKEELEKQKNEANLNSLKAYYETIEKEEEINEQRNRIDVQNRLLLYGGLMLVFLLILLFIFYLLHRKNIRVVEKLSRDLKKEMVLSKTDPLTGFPNKKAIEEKLKDAVLEWKKSRKDFSLLFLSFENVKDIDREYGVGTGESIQKFIGLKLVDEFKGQDFIALWKPFVYTVYFPDTGNESLNSVEKKIAERLSDLQFETDDTIIPLSFKFGSSTYSGEGSLKDFITQCKANI